MISIANIPSIKDFFPSNSKLCLNSWAGKKDHPYFFSKSKWALQYIIANSIKNKGKKINVFLPAFFCEETVDLIRSNDLSIIYYNIDSDFHPNWDELSAKANNTSPDIFVLTHYFGRESQITKADKFCKKHSCLFVEDCAHVRQKYGKIGKKSDFSFYSLYKHFPIPDGSLLISKKEQEKLKFKTETEINKQLKFATIWSLKRAFQNFFSMDSKPQPESFKNSFSSFSHEGSEINFLSLRMLRSNNSLELTNEALRLNYNKWTTIIKSLFSNYIVDEVSSPTHPYLAVYRFNKIDKSVTEVLNNLKIPYFNWPQLPKEVFDNPAFQLENDLKKRIICLPLNSRITDADYAKLLKKIKATKKADITFRDATTVQSQKISSPIPLTQSLSYLKAKAEIEGKDLTNKIIFWDDNEIGALRYLSKKIFGVNLVIINRSPVLYKEDIIARSLVTSEVRSFIKANVSRSIIIWKQDTLQPFATILEKMIKALKFNLSPYHSSYIDLTKDLDLLRSNLNSKWRNQLKKSESSGMEFTFTSDIKTIKWITEKYKSEMKQKNFKGIPTTTIEKIATNDPSKIVAVTAKAEDHIIAANLLYIDNKTATYLVGWNSDEGRSLCANNFLLWKSIEELKERGSLFFDLGGLDEKNTPSITKFKRGVNAKEYKLGNESVLINL